MTRKLVRAAAAEGQVQDDSATASSRLHLLT